MKIRIWLLVFIFLVACNLNQGAEESSDDLSSAKIAESLSFPEAQLIFSYTETPSGLLFIQVQHPDFGIDDQEIRGTLVREGKCLRIINERLEESATAIWVPTVEIDESQGAIQLNNVRSAGTITEGDRIRFAATRFSDMNRPEWASLIPDDCGEPYYVLDGISILE